MDEVPHNLERAAPEKGGGKARSMGTLMHLARLLKPELIRMELETVNPPETESPPPAERIVAQVKESVIRELADLLDRSGRVGNKTKLFRDLHNREKKASTGIGRGFAIPHVRTKEAREFLFGFARSTPGVPFEAQDGGLVHIFLAFVSPPHDDQLYMSFYKRIAEAILTTTVFDDLMSARNEGEVIRAIKWFD
jgi:PTS system fructose-specific IIC component